MQNFLNSVVDPAVKVLIPAIVLYALNVGMPFLIDKLMKSKAAFLVKAAESLFQGSGKGDEKFAYVVDVLSDYAVKRLFYFISSKRLRAYIEAAVTELHAELPKVIENVEKQIEEGDK
jgi:hypothetical protein